jgi:hypothetical protein
VTCQDFRGLPIWERWSTKIGNATKWAMTKKRPNYKSSLYLRRRCIGEARQLVHAFMFGRHRSDMGSITVEQLPVAVKMGISKEDRYVIREATTKQELDGILDVVWAANYYPYEPFVQLFFPVLGYTSAHREAAIAESKERFWNQHQADANSHWYYALDTVTGEKIGCAQWVVSQSNPFAAGVPKLTAPWWPEGECRNFCESILNQVYKPRASWMTRPHCGKWRTGTLFFFFEMSADYIVAAIGWRIVVVQLDRVSRLTS